MTLTGVVGRLFVHARRLVPVILTLALFGVFVAALASTYFGSARSPYDTCYGTNGRAVRCSALEALR